jgi:hypothetical protein
VWFRGTVGFQPCRLSLLKITPKAPLCQSRIIANKRAGIDPKVQIIEILLKFLNDNSGAIQAVSSVLTAIATVLLLWSLDLSWETVNVARQQLRASLLPSPAIEMKRGSHGESTEYGQPHDWILTQMLTIKIRNEGNVSFKVIRVSVNTLQGNNLQSKPKETTNQCPAFSNVVLHPTAEVSREVTLQLPVHYDASDEHSISIECQDLMVIGSHRFIRSKGGIIRHEPIESFAIRRSFSKWWPWNWLKVLKRH